MIYPDLRVLLSLLVPGEHTREASDLVRRPGSVPLILAIVHRLQVENGLLRSFHSPQPETRAVAKHGLLLWRQYLEEGVFEIRSVPLPEAFSQAAAWNAESAIQPPRWHLLLHVALAASLNASFLSFDPILRKIAKKAGLTLLPAKL